jgi:hypothetical protein
MTPAESELFDAQFTESPPDPRKNYAVTSAANQVILPPPASTVEAQKTPTSGVGEQQVSTSIGCFWRGAVCFKPQVMVFLNSERSE